MYFQTSKDEYEIDIGTKIFIDKTATPKPVYVQKLQHNYDTQIEQVDFTKPGVAIQTINSWAENVTHGHIQHLISEGMYKTVNIKCN